MPNGNMKKIMQMTGENQSKWDNYNPGLFV